MLIVLVPWGAARGAESACDDTWSRELLNTSSSRGGRGGAHWGLWAGAGRDGAGVCRWLWCWADDDALPGADDEKMLWDAALAARGLRRTSASIFSRAASWSTFHLWRSLYVWYAR